jgi:predicted nucleic acid-binding protein
MSTSKGLVLDANILLRAVFGNRVRERLYAYEEVVAFYAPDVSITDARKHIPPIAARRGTNPAFAELTLDRIVDSLIHVVDRSLYEEFEERARARISSRDADDWPIVATAMLLKAPIWTEDQDFFGCGIATWTSDKIEIYLRDA